MIRITATRALSSLESDVRRVVPGAEVLEMTQQGRFVVHLFYRPFRESDAIALRNLHGVTSAELVMPRERHPDDQWRFSEPGPE